jgi:hypothetical protein
MVHIMKTTPLAIGSRFLYHGAYFRATAFYKIVETKRTSTTAVSRLIDEMLIAEGVDPTVRLEVVYADPAEATFVSGSGVAGCIAHIRDVVVLGMVEWSVEAIKREQSEYTHNIGCALESLDRKYRTELAAVNRSAGKIALGLEGELRHAEVQHHKCKSREHHLRRSQRSSPRDIRRAGHWLWRAFAWKMEIYRLSRQLRAARLAA